MNRIDRLTAILIHLQGKPNVNIESLTNRFEVSPRTIFRDIKSLVEAGVPIGGDARNGYFIVDGYHLPPVVFNKNEAAALLMGSKLISHHADKEVAGNFEEAMLKVRAVLRYADRGFFDNLDKNIAVAPPQNKNAEFPDSHISEVQQGLAQQQCLRLTYYSNYKDQSTVRNVEPLGLVYYSARWHLIAYCRLRMDMRDFRCDRIKRCELLQEKFDPAKHPTYQHFLKQMLTGTESMLAIVRFSKRASRFISTQKYHFGFAEEQAFNGIVEMKFYTSDYQYFARWLMMFGNEVTVVSPEELRVEVASMVAELYEHHQQMIAEFQR